MLVNARVRWELGPEGFMKWDSCGYKDIYTLFSDDDKELEKIFEKEGFYGKEQDKAQETEEE